MIKIFLKLLIVVFLMESTWAVAAQYCPHELGLKVSYLSHDANKADSDKSLSQLPAIGADHSKSDTDNDCPYCHLGSMKSMVSILSLPSAVTESITIITIVYSYADVTPRHPDRPNWLAAV